MHKHHIHHTFLVQKEERFREMRFFDHAGTSLPSVYLGRH